jgi:hypothetical protein
MNLLATLTHPLLYRITLMCEMLLIQGGWAGYRTGSKYKLTCVFHFTLFIAIKLPPGNQCTVLLQEAKYVESWPNTNSAWAGWSRFDIPVDGGVHSLLLCTRLHGGLLPVTRLPSRKILSEQNIKKRTGPALCVLCGTATLW